MHCTWIVVRYVVLPVQESPVFPPKAKGDVLLTLGCGAVLFVVAAIRRRRNKE